VGETRTTIVLPTPVFKHFKMQAILEDKSMKQKLTEIICEELEPIEKPKLGDRDEAPYQTKDK